MGSVYREITAHLVRTFPAPESGQSFVRDSLLPGFGLRVTVTGSKAFIVEVKVNGRSRRKTLGKADKLDIRTARKMAKEWIGQSASGRDLVAEAQEAKVKQVTLAEVFADYMDGRKLAANTVRDYEMILRTHLKDWRDKPVASITRQMAAQRHAALSQHSETAANKTMRVLGALFNFAQGEYRDNADLPIVAENPVRALSHRRMWHREQPRSNILKAHEFSAWWETTELLDPVARDYLRFVLMTGLRRREATDLRWRDIDLQGRTLCVASTKNGNSHTLPLSDWLHSLLSARLILAGDSPWVFASELSKSGHIEEPKKFYARVEKLCGIRASVHDLRRTFASYAEMLVSGGELKQLMNHSDRGDVTMRHYVVVDVERLRAPMQRITDYFLQQTGKTITPE